MFVDTFLCFDNSGGDDNIDNYNHSDNDDDGKDD